jgi:hypothetical protein
VTLVFQSCSLRSLMSKRIRSETINSECGSLFTSRGSSSCVAVRRDLTRPLRDIPRWTQNRARGACRPLRGTLARRVTRACLAPSVEIRALAIRARVIRSGWADVSVPRRVRAETRATRWAFAFRILRLSFPHRCVHTHALWHPWRLWRDSIRDSDSKTRARNLGARFVHCS